MSIWFGLFGAASCAANAQKYHLQMMNQRADEHHRNYMLAMVGQMEAAQKAQAAPTPAKKPGPCGGCGSRETITHHGARMCPYCRSDR